MSEPQLSICQTVVVCSQCVLIEIHFVTTYTHDLVFFAFHCLTVQRIGDTRKENKIFRRFVCGVDNEEQRKRNNCTPKFFFCLIIIILVSNCMGYIYRRNLKLNVTDEKKFSEIKVERLIKGVCD